MQKEQFDNVLTSDKDFDAIPPLFRSFFNAKFFVCSCVDHKIHTYQYKNMSMYTHSSLLVLVFVFAMKGNLWIPSNKPSLDIMLAWNCWAPEGFGNSRYCNSPD